LQIPDIIRKTRKDIEMVENKSSVHEEIISVNGVDLYTISMGEGIPIVFVHGAAGLGHSYFLPAAKEISGKFRTISYDQRGCGRSSAVSLSDITIKNHVEDLEGLRNKLGLKRLNLVGHSLGALLALFYSAKYPDSVASLVTANAGPPFIPEMLQQLGGEFASRTTKEDKLELKRIMDSAEFKSRDPKAIEQYFSILYKPFFKNPTTISQVNWDFSETTAQHVVETEEHIVPQIFQQDPVGKLNQINCPTLVLHSEQDPIPESFSRYLAEHINGSQYVALQGVGHFAYLEDPEKFRNAILPFLAKEAK
jgi:proline iminopeptidase